MSITFSSNVEVQSTKKDEPCLCAQMADNWGAFYRGEDTPAIREELKQAANPQCPQCQGTGIEEVEHDDAPHMNLTNANAQILLRVLDIPFDYVGEMTIPEARRAIMRAMSRSSLEEFERPEHIEHGKPREIEPGIVDLKPLRYFDPGVNTDKIKDYVMRFADFVSQVIKRGGTKIYWG